MTVFEAIRNAERKGIRFSIAGDKLRVLYPNGECTEEREAWVSRNRLAILKHLRSQWLHSILKREGLLRFAELIEAAQSGELPKQDEIVTLYVSDRRRWDCANLTNWVTYHAHCYEHRKSLGYRADSRGRRICHQQRLLYLELARRWWEAQKGQGEQGEA